MKHIIKTLTLLCCTLFTTSKATTPRMTPECYEHTTNILEKNKVVNDLMTHCYGKDNPFLALHTIIELTSELQYATARHAFAHQSSEDAAHARFLNGALERMNSSLSALLADFLNESERYTSLNALLHDVRETKEYIDLNLRALTEQSHTYRRASRQQKRFIGITAVTALFAGSTLKKILTGLGALIAAVVIYRSMTKEVREIRAEVKGLYPNWVTAVNDLKKVLLDKHSELGFLRGGRLTRSNKTNTFQRALLSFDVKERRGLTSSDFEKDEWRKNPN